MYNDNQRHFHYYICRYSKMVWVSSFENDRKSPCRRNIDQPVIGVDHNPSVNLLRLHRLLWEPIMYPNILLMPNNRFTCCMYECKTPEHWEDMIFIVLWIFSSEMLYPSRTDIKAELKNTPQLSPSSFIFSLNIFYVMPILSMMREFSCCIYRKCFSGICAAYCNSLTKPPQSTFSRKMYPFKLFRSTHFP